MAEGYTVKHWDDFEEMEGSGQCTWHLARRSIGVDSFGFNVVDIETGGQIPEHDETPSNQDEVFISLSGDPTFVADDEEIPAPVGTFIHYEPQVKRTIRNHGDATARVLLIGVPRDSGYQPRDWT